MKTFSKPTHLTDSAVGMKCLFYSKYDIYILLSFGKMATSKEKLKNLAHFLPYYKSTKINLNG